MIKIYNIAICDDEEIFVQTLKETLEQYATKHGMDFRYFIFHDGGELLDGYRPDLDLIFMDIKMKSMNGLETAEEIRKIDSTAGLIFLTSLPQYVWKGYEYGAVNYLLKPLKYGRLKMELDRFFSRYEGKEEAFFSFFNDKGKYRVLYKNICYMETCKRNVMIHFDGQEQVVYKSMKEITPLFESRPDFARCHGSYIVNLSHIKGVENLEAILTTQERIPISQPKRKEFMMKMANFWGNML